MLCVANVALSDWPVGQVRDVDPSSERIRGLLRAGYVVPLVRASETPPAVADDGQAGYVEAAAEDAEQPSSTAERRPRKKRS